VHVVFPTSRPASRDLLVVSSDILPTLLTFDIRSEGIPSSYYRVHAWYEKSRMAGLQSGEGGMMIDSVVWA